MKTLDLVQGSPEWHQHRATARNASEAAALMNESRFMTRNELLRRKATGHIEEVDAATQARFDEGHRTEAEARAVVETLLLGEDLYPLVATTDDGYLSASFDGITMGEDTAYEHKLWNQKLVEAMRAGDVPMEYAWQLEQQLLVGAPNLKKIIFACSDGTPENIVHIEYVAVPGRAEKLISAWKQFDKDLADYVPPEVIPAATAAPQMALPALSIQVKGEITLQDNLKTFGEQLEAYVGRINKKPQTDQDFADLDATAKALAKAEEALDAAESAALAQTKSIDDMRRTVGLYRELARTNRLMVEKLVKAEKENRRAQIQRGGVDGLAAHVKALNEKLGKAYMPFIAADFAGAMRGKKTMTSLQNAVDSELARAKAEATEIASTIQFNLTMFEKIAAGYVDLFSDLDRIVTKSQEDFAATVKTRITEHKTAMEKRAEAERERIRIEEERKATAKAEAEAKAKADAEARQKAADEAAERARVAALAPPPVAEKPAQIPPQGMANVTPIPAAKPKVTLAAKGGRPSDDDIINTLAAHYRVPRANVTEWLMDMALSAKEIA